MISFVRAYGFTVLSSAKRVLLFLYHCSVTGPDGETQSYNYDKQNRLASIDLPGAGSMVYNEYKDGVLKKLTLPGGIKVAYEFDSQYRPLTIEMTDATAEQNSLMKREFTYSPQKKSYFPGR